MIKTLNVIKKNRKYFACKIGNYKCKLIIDENSRDIELGEKEYKVIDKSVRTKYGTDVIYQLDGEQDNEKTGICTLKHFSYNSQLVDSCKELNGKYDRESKAWVFSEMVEDMVDELDEFWNSELVTIEIEAISDYENLFTSKKPLDFYGYTICRARGRDTGAELGDNVAMIKGSIGSGGSVKNWTTNCKTGSIFRLKVPEKVLDFVIEEGLEKDYWNIKKLT